MIRINLLSTPRKGKITSAANTGVVELVIFGLLVLVGALAVFFWYQMYENWIADARASIKRERKEVAKLHREIKMVERYKATKKLLKKQLEIIERLKRAKSGPVRVLDELSIRIPKQVWLARISQRRGRLTINGEAEANEWVALFLKKLEDSPYFKAVELKFTRKIRSNKFGARNLERIRFSLSCQVTFTS